MKKWVQKFIHQFEVDGENQGRRSEDKPQNIDIGDEKATVLFVIDTLSKYLLDLDSYPSRKARGILEELGQSIVNAEEQKVEKVLFRFRQFFSSYRINEYTYIQKTFDDFRNIIWDFVEQLNEDLDIEQSEVDLKNHFDELKEAVEANSIDALKTQSRKFIDSYIEYQYKKEELKTQTLSRIQKNLNQVNQELVEANQAMLLDHLTKAYNRKSFDEQINKQWQLSRVSGSPAVLVALDIDHFKKVNDNYGHQIGDAILIECVNLLKDSFPRKEDFVARVGGEEFSIILSDTNLSQAIDMVEKAMDTIREAVYVHEDYRIQFSVSVGIAPLKKEENIEAWMKRADEALYFSKQNGRDRYTVAGAEKVPKVS